MRYILYHSSCYDGFGAAYAAFKKFGYVNTKYIAVGYSEPIPEMEDGSEVYLLDFFYPIDTLKELTSKHKIVNVIDHHHTAFESYKAIIGFGEDVTHDGSCEVNINFDMTKSGALLAWEYFHPISEVPTFIKLISDRDLWKFEDDRSRSFHAALTSYPMDFGTWSHFENESILRELLSQGEALMRLQSQQVDKICEKAFMTYIGGREVPVVNTSVSWSEVGNKLLELYPKHPFAASYTDLSDGTRMFSLRSNAPFDVSEVAKLYGGGGHKQAAGFKTKVKFRVSDD